jgi:hypothetical protein
MRVSMQISTKKDKEKILLELSWTKSKEEHQES